MRTYGANEELEDKKRCIKRVWPSGHFRFNHQCTRKRGYGYQDLFCKQHAKTILLHIQEQIARGE